MARIAVIGAGKIGGTLGDVWRRAGHEVTFGVRDAADRDDADAGRTFADPAKAVRDADVVLFAVPGTVVDDTVASLAGDLDGRVLIDASNRFGTAKMRSLVLEGLANESFGGDFDC